jgi:hypothetical protein
VTYKADPITGIKIVYDKRIRVGELRWDKKKGFMRMNPKTKPDLEQAVTYANAPDLFKRFEIMPYRSYYLPQAFMLNPPIIINPKYTAVN